MAAECESKEQGEENDADDIVPVEQFETPTAGGELLGVGPGAPAEHGDHTEKHGHGVAVQDEHGGRGFP
jgi:hypothetical protein